MSFAIVDIETTGGSPVFHRVVEIGMVLISNGKIVSQYKTLINPEIPIPYSVTLIHGITDAMVAGAPRFEEVADEISQFLEGNIFVAHSVNFDFGFIKAEFNRLGLAFNHKRICTVRLSRKMLPNLKSHSLASVCQYFNVKNNRAHRALEDAMATANIWFEMEKMVDFQTVLAGFLKKNSKELALPPNLDQLAFDLLPEKIGVYLFHDQQGKVVYVGKAICIKDRVKQHFSSQTHTKAKSTFLEAIYDVSFELAGSELMALLLENELIKKHYPKFNSTLKTFHLNFGIFQYENQAGFQRLTVGEVGKSSHPVVTFKTKLEAISALLKVSMQNGLCLRLNGLLQDQKTICAYDSVQGQSCKICTENQSAEQYNEIVDKVIEADFCGNSFVLKTSGRTLEEWGLIWVEKGRIKGYGYLPKMEMASSLDDLKPYLKSYYDTQDAQSILKSYWPKAKKVGQLFNQLDVFQMDLGEPNGINFFG